MCTHYTLWCTDFSVCPPALMTIGQGPNSDVKESISYPYPGLPIRGYCQPSCMRSGSAGGPGSWEAWWIRWWAGRVINVAGGNCRNQFLVAAESWLLLLFHPLVIPSPPGRTYQPTCPPSNSSRPAFSPFSAAGFPSCCCCGHTGRLFQDRRAVNMLHLWVPSIYEWTQWVISTAQLLWSFITEA